VVAADLELLTWDALKPEVVELVTDPAIVSRLARFFARLRPFEALLAFHRDHVIGSREPLRAAILKNTISLREEGQSLPAALKILG
jgi:hypothetical protein